MIAVLLAGEHDAGLDAAIAAARQGTPQLLVIEGAQGSGKTTLLRALVERWAGHGKVTAEASEDDIDSYSTLARLGVKTPPSTSPLVAAQSIRERLHALTAGKPALLALDDVQWSDPQTIDALFQLIDRSEPGDSLLVAMASHLLTPEMRDRVQPRLDRGVARRLVLGRLPLSHAHRLAEQYHPEISNATVERIWRMTDGNLLYFTSVLAEHDVDEVADMPFLPAPEAFSRLITRRLAQLGSAPTALMRAIAVMGGEWHPLVITAALAEVDKPTEALEALVNAGLASQRVSTELGGFVRPVHALVRAAVYQSTPYDLRRSLHLAAASLEVDYDAALAHRVAAAASLDNRLSEDLVIAARRNHDHGSFHRAAEQLRWASSLSEEAESRRNLLFDSVYERLFANDQAGVTEELTQTQDGADDRAALILGTAAALGNRWREALDALTPITRQPTRSVEPLVRYRAEVIAAWSGQGVGAPTAWIEDRLRTAVETEAFDPILQGFVTLTKFQLRGREQEMSGVRALTAHLSLNAAEVPLASSYELLTRGIVAALTGDLPRARADLSEMERRFQQGIMDLGDGLTHAFLGLAMWLNGEEQLAEAKFRLSREMSRASANPAASALTVLGMIGAGDFDQADRTLAAVCDRLAREPWQEAVRLYTIALTARLHAGGNQVAQAGALDRFETQLGEQARDVGPASYPVWLVHRAMLSIWAGRLHEARTLAGRLGASAGELPWVAAASQWLSGLIAERNGQEGSARRYFDAALKHGIGAIPLFHAHVLADLARLTKDPSDLDRAVELYRNLRQIPYVQRLSRLQATPSADPFLGVLATLSEREQDVLALITSGLSYEQVARELFISRSTVSYHLSRIYAKTGVGTRHQLTQLVRVAN